MYFAIRVDASNQIGTGHLTRCLTLANALRQRGAEIRFVSRHMSVVWQEMISSQGHQFLLLETTEPEAIDELAHAQWLGTSQSGDARATKNALADREWDWLIVDHYALDSRWESALRETCRNIMVIDDLADREHDCDLLIDQNLYSDMLSRYIDKVGPRCRILAGPRYALLRLDFGVIRQRCSVRQGNVRRVLVFFGGIDAENYTGRAITALAALRNAELQVDVVIGAKHPQREQLLIECAAHGYACHVQTNRMADLIAAADLAIGAGGSTTWERCCLGLPTLAICVANNQRQQIADAAAAGLLYIFNEHEDVEYSITTHVRALIDNPTLRSLLSANGMRAVDGRGISRVVNALNGSAIEMRIATTEDSRNLFNWRNDALIRAVSRSTDPIDWEDHQRWLASVLATPDRILLIGMTEGAPLGMVRYDRAGSEAEVSIYLVPERLSSGLGDALLHAAELWLRENQPEICNIRASVFGTNERSIRLFANAGYTKELICFTKRLTQDE